MSLRPAKATKDGPRRLQVPKSKRKRFTKAETEALIRELPGIALRLIEAYLPIEDLGFCPHCGANAKHFRPFTTPQFPKTANVKPGAQSDTPEAKP